MFSDLVRNLYKNLYMYLHLYLCLYLYLSLYYLKVRAFLSAYSLLLHHLTTCNHLTQAATGNNK